jgi:glutathione S-transferase
MAFTLVIGNKNYSSWSMRPWVLMKQMGIAFEERMVKFNSADWADHIARLSPSKLVPVLWDGVPGEAGSFAVWDTLAIVEFVADRFPDKAIWPADPRSRARARSLACEMHAGFRNLRSTMPMNIRSQHPGKGYTDATARDIARVEQLWADCRREFGAGGPFLFGAFGAADAMFAPVTQRFATYQPPLSAATRAYCEAVSKAPGVAAWIADAKMEAEFVPEDEPYCPAPGA